MTTATLSLKDSIPVKKRAQLSKSAYDLAHVKSVTAWALVHPDANDPKRGNMAGRIVCNWSDNPNGSVCTATVHVWSGPLKDTNAMHGNAGGGGYCKFSAAVSDALWRGGVEHSNMSGVGESAVRAFFEGLGYSCLQVIG